MSVLRNARQVHGRSQDVCTPRYLFNPIARFLAPRNRGGQQPDGAEVDVDVLDDDQIFIDLDPCWNRKSPVRAHVTWTKRQDGLRRDWAEAFAELAAKDLIDAGPPGTIFCNPPWEDLEPWLWRCAAARDYAEVIALVPLRPHRNNFAAAFSADAWCLLRPVVFEGETNAFPMACVLLYWGPRAEAFCRFFSGPERWQGMVLTREAWGRNVSRTMKRYPNYRSNGAKKKTAAAEPKKIHPAVHALRRILRYAFRAYFYDDEDGGFDPQRQEEQDFLEEPIPTLIEAFPPASLTDWTRVDDVIRAIAEVTGDEAIAKALEGVFTSRRTLKELEPEYWQHLAKKTKADAAEKKKKSASATAKKAVKTRKTKAKAKKRATPIKDLRERSKRLAAKRSTHVTKPAKKAPPKPARAAAAKPAKAKAKLVKASTAALRKLHAAGKKLTNYEMDILVATGDYISASGPGQPRRLTLARPTTANAEKARQQTLDEMTEAFADEGDDEGTDSFREPGASTSEPGPAAAAARTGRNGTPKNGHRRGGAAETGGDGDDAVVRKLGASGSIVNLEDIGKAIGKSKATVIRTLHRLRDRKLVRMEGGGRGARWVVL